MRYLSLLVVLVVVFSACKKNKYTTEPQVKFKSISPDNAASSLTFTQKEFAPKLTIEVTDAEGDLGLVPGVDTTRIYIKNILLNKIDSFDMPEALPGTKNFKADVEVNLYNTLGCRAVGPPRPRTDTIYYEVYVKDFAKNKSNVITTDKPVYYRCL